MRISRLQVVTAFTLDRSVLLSLGPALKHLEKSANARLFQVNAPDDAPPSLPRLVLRSKDGANMNVCQDRFDLSVSPPAHVASDLSEAAAYLKRVFAMAVEPLLDDMPEYEWLGVVLTLEYLEDPITSASSSQAVYPIMKKLTMLPINQESLRNFRLQYGYEANGLFYNIAINGFEERQINLALNQNEAGFVKIDAGDYPLSACGVSLLHDVNNRPGEKSNVRTDLDHILERQIHAIELLPQTLGLESILS